MEYSPMMILILWALTPSDCVPLRDNSSEEAEVRELPRPSMVVENPQEYRIPGYFTFNDGKPFLVEKDPLTGAIDFNIKTTPVVTQGGKFPLEPNDYFYEDEENISSDQIDRKDGNIGGSKNDIKDPSKAQADLHKFLNLPVHYSSQGKFPLISSSYANTKVQGHGSTSYSNHKPYSTSSTVRPTYYDLRTSSSTSPPSTTTPTSTTTASTSTSTSTTRQTSTRHTTPTYEYEYLDYDYDKLETDTEVKSPASSTTQRPPQPSSGSTTLPPSTTTLPPKLNITASPKGNLSVVTSLPVDFHQGQKNVTTESPNTFTSDPTKEYRPPNFDELPEDSYADKETWELTSGYNRPEKPKPSGSIKPSDSDPNGKQNITSSSDGRNNTQTEKSVTKIDVVSVKPIDSFETNNPNGPQTGGVLQQERPLTNSSFTFGRPIGAVIFGTRKPGTNFQDSQPSENYLYTHPRPPNRPPLDVITSSRPFTNYNQVVNGPPTTNLVLNRNFTVLNSDQHSQKHNGSYPNQNPGIPNLNMRPPPFKHPGFKPSRPETQSYSPQEYNIGQLQKVKPELQKSPPHHIETNKPEAQNNEGVYFSNKPIITNSGPAGFSGEEVFFKVQPERRPQGSVEEPPRFQHLQFHQPTKVENHFIRVPPGQMNPSYSLQTSFSIGVPPANSESTKEHPRPGQGVGQVLLPDEDPVIGQGAKPEVVKRPTTWSSERPFPSSYPGRPQRPPLRFPVTELHSPAYSNDNYPRPQWESHLKPPHFYNPGNALQKIDSSQGHTQPPKRVKPQGGLQRHDLPNILPQFRPNAKVGHGEYHAHFTGPITKLREPLDTLQPPPLPRPLHVRLNRNDEVEGESTFETFLEKSTQLPLVHRRTGPQANSRVTTLQMMQQNPPRRPLRPDYKERLVNPEKEEPVFVVYPSNGATKNIIPNEDVVVVGTRGPQRPLPPDNLGLDDKLDNFQIDDNKNFPIHARDRIDTPILKTKPTPKPIIKNEFPYTLIRPTETTELKESTKISDSKEYSAFSPTEHTSTEEIQDHDSEINLIPYLQDYMPFATKKPSASKPIEPPSWNLEEKSTLKPISVTLNTKIGTTSNSDVMKSQIEGNKSQNQLSRDESVVIVGTSGTDYIVNPPNMHSKYKISSNHRPQDSSLSSTNGPQPQDFQAPFHASLSAPSQGWTIVSTQNSKEPEIDNDDSTTKPSEETKFDIENFKPQLFGGFKPIISPIVPENKGVSQDSKVTER